MMIRNACEHNVMGTLHAMRLAKRMKKLEVFLHASTTFAYCQKMHINEEIYPIAVDPADLIHALNTMSDEELEVYKHSVLEGRPNNYTFAKAVAEHVIHQQRPKDMTVVIARPSIVCPAIEDPTTGWVDTFNGPAGLTVLASLGILRVFDFDPKVKVRFSCQDKQFPRTESSQVI